MDPENDENEDVEIISTHDEKVKIVGEILSNDSSRKILNLLNASNEMTINEIAQKTGLSLSLVTHHLKRMQSAQIVKVSKVGQVSQRTQDELLFYNKPVVSDSSI